MQRRFFILALVVALSLLAAPRPAQAQDDETNRTITVSGEAQVRVVPDEVILALGIETSNPILARAKQQNDAIARKVLALAGQYDIPAEHVQTDYIRVFPYYRDRPYRLELETYVIQKAIVITLRNLAQFESLLTDVLEAGVNHIYGIEFRTTELRQHRDLARELAIRAAQEKAAAMAGALGLETGSAISIREDQIFWWSTYRGWGTAGAPMSQNVVQEMSGAELPLDGGFAPGQIVVSARVSVTFEIKAAR